MMGQAPNEREDFGQAQLYIVAVDTPSRGVRHIIVRRSPSMTVAFATDLQ
jgi:hypothetical protein